MNRAALRRTAFIAAVSLLFGTGGLLFAASAVLAPRDGRSEDGRPAPKTIITGSRMNLLNKGDAVEFVGGVKVVRGNDSLSADRVLSEEKKGLVHAWGNVYLRRNVPEENIKLEAWSQEAAYNTDTSSATLRNKGSQAKLRRSDLSSDGERLSKTSYLEMKAVRMTFFESTDPRPSAVMGYPLVSTAPVAASTSTFGAMEAQGDVYVFSQEVSTSAPTKKTEIWATESFFEGRGRRAVFWNKDGGSAAFPFPRARQEEDDAVRNLKGETLIYHMDDQRLVVQGRVSAEMWTPKKSTDTMKKEGR